MSSEEDIIGSLEGETEEGMDFNLALRPKALVSVGACRCYKLPCFCNLNLILKDSSVSGQHFRLWAVLFDGRNPAIVYLKDTSMNGTFVNGEKVGRNNIRILTDGDVVSVKFGMRATFYNKSKVQSTEKPLTVHDWLVHPIVLGTGSFGKVLVAESKFTRNKLWAVKITAAKFAGGEVQSEARLLVKLNHPNIIEVHSVVLRKDRLFTFQELLCGGDLFSYLTRGKYLSAIPENEGRFFVYQILLAVKYLHSKGIIHRDIKPDNILLSSPEQHCRIVLADFGVAIKTDGQTSPRSVAGTSEYCAPEVYEQDGYDCKCDIWSVGVITHILLTGVSPFLVRHDHEATITRAHAGKLNFQMKQWSGISLSAQNFVIRTLSLSPTERPTAKQCLKHSWIASNLSEMEELYRSI